MTATASLTGLFAALNQCREPDFVLLGVIADALEEAGDERAEGYRWACEERRFPFVRVSVKTHQRTFLTMHSCETMPCPLGSELSTYWQNEGYYPTITAAFDDLCSMIRKRNAAQPQEG